MLQRSLINIKKHILLLLSDSHSSSFGHLPYTERQCVLKDGKDMRAAGMVSWAL